MPGKGSSVLCNPSKLWGTEGVDDLEWIQFWSYHSHGMLGKRAPSPWIEWRASVVLVGHSIAPEVCLPSLGLGIGARSSQVFWDSFQRHSFPDVPTGWQWHQRSSTHCSRHGTLGVFSLDIGNDHQSPFCSLFVPLHHWTWVGRAGPVFWVLEKPPGLMGPQILDFLVNNNKIVLVKHWSIIRRLGEKQGSSLGSTWIWHWEL